jgi:hypothetical protein
VVPMPGRSLLMQAAVSTRGPYQPWVAVEWPPVQIHSQLPSGRMELTAAPQVHRAQMVAMDWSSTAKAAMAVSESLDFWELAV